MQQNEPNGFTVDEFCKFINQKSNHKIYHSNLSSRQESVDEFSLSNLLINQSISAFLGSEYNMSEYVEKICLALPMKLIKHEADQIKQNLIKFIYPILLLFGICF